VGQNTYVAVGNKEDISDVITNITPKDTPFYSACGRGKATSTKHEWLEDSLRAPAANAVVEGAEYAVDAVTPRVRLDNVTQIFRAGYGVTGTQEAVLKHGVSSEIGYDMSKAMKEIALDIELALISQATKNPATAATARLFGGVPFWILTNDVPAGGGDLTEALMNDALESCWDAGGKPKKVYLSGGQKRKVSSWSGDGDKYLEQNSKKLVNSISVYESDFGIVSFAPHRMMGDDTVFVIDPDYWKIAYLRPLHTENLPKTGDNLKKIILGELTLEARAEKASAKITGLVL